MKDKIVCLDLQALFLHYSSEIDEDGFSDYVYGSHFIIRRQEEYYDLFRDSYSGLRLCCDGEECKILEETETEVKLISANNIDDEDLEGIDTTFVLSREEYKIATI